MMAEEDERLGFDDEFGLTPYDATEVFSPIGQMAPALRPLVAATPALTGAVAGT